MKPALLLLLAGLSLFRASAGPNIQATPSVLNCLHYTTSAGPSTAQTVVLQSGMMGVASGIVTITGSTHYAVSLNNAAFTNTITIAYSGDSLARTTVYVRLKAGLAPGNFLNETISVTAPAASTTIDVSGLVTDPCVVKVNSVTDTSASFSWNATGVPGYECTIDQYAADPTAPGTATGGTSFAKTGLQPGVAYYLHVRGAGPGGNYTPWTTKAAKMDRHGASSNNRDRCAPDDAEPARGAQPDYRIIGAERPRRNG